MARRVHSGIPEGTVPFAAPSTRGGCVPAARLSSAAGENFMSTTIWIVLLAAVFVLGALLAWFVLTRRRRDHLRDRFGPEYDRVVRASGKPSIAEKELERREDRVEQLDIRPLPAEERLRFTGSWRDVQTRFVDEPARSVHEADELVERVMERRGYPVGSFEQQLDDVSVDHPHVISNYRAAHAIATASQGGRASTEDLRQAMVHYRALFEDLLESGYVEDGDHRERKHERTTTA
jgi:hypothetical protein